MRAAIRAVAQKRRRWGSPRVVVQLRREGWRDNHKRIERLYRTEGLQVRRRTRKRISRGEREPLEKPSGMNQLWAMDFINDAMMSGRKLKVLWIIDCFNRECLALLPDTSIGGPAPWKSSEPAGAIPGRS